MLGNCGIHGNTGAIYPYTMYNLTNSAISVTISFGNLIAAGGSGTVNEIGLFTNFDYLSNGYDTFMVTHNILGAGVAFVAGNLLVGTLAINI
jgi:hypothetical protein